MTVSIVSPSAAAVKARRHPRFRREDIPAPEIDPRAENLPGDT